MSKALSRLLDKPEQVVSAALQKLEKMSGYPSEDVRLMSDNVQLLRQKVTELGLDPNDTTDEELYHTLLSRFDKDAAQLDEVVGMNGEMPLEQRIDLSINLTRQSIPAQEGWVLKTATAKNLLREHEPKRLMKQLHYRTVDSMIKREKIDEIYLAVPYLESGQWQKSFVKSLSKLSSLDYMVRPMSIVKLPTSRWQHVQGPDFLVAVNSLVGVVAIWPSPKLAKAHIFNLSLLLAQGLEDLGVQINPGTITNLSPVFNWWDGVAHLLTYNVDQLVSFNLKDIATSHLHGLDFNDRSLQHGQQSLWNELIRRYKTYTEVEEDILAKAEQELSQQANKAGNSLAPKQFAVEQESAGGA